MAIAYKTETESVRTEATPLRSSEDPSLVKAGLEYVLLFIFSSIFFIVEYQFCKQFMPTIHAIFEGKFIEKPNGYLLLRIWRKHLYKIFFNILFQRLLHLTTLSLSSAITGSSLISLMFIWSKTKCHLLNQVRSLMRKLWPPLHKIPKFTCLS